MKEIFERRSVRQYLDKEIPREEIEQLLRAAMRAPSAVNQQPWEFIVVEDREKLNEITTFHPYSKMLRQAACAVIVCGNLQRRGLHRLISGFRIAAQRHRICFWKRFIWGLEQYGLDYIRWQVG